MRVQTKLLSAELAWASRAICKKGVIPILSNVMLEAEPGLLRLTATDLETAMVTELPAEETTPWKITVPAAFLLKYLKKIEESHVELVPPKDNNWLFLTHGDSAKIEVAGMGVESYPELPVLRVKGYLSGIQKAIPRAIFAISAEESRFTLNGALLEGKNGESQFVSTDGHRLSFVPVTYKGEQTRALVRKRALTELIHLDADSAGIGWDENHLLFEHGNRKILSRKLTGNFPDYYRVLPKDFPYAILVDATELYKVVDRVKLFADERSHAVRFTIGNGKLTVKAEICENGRASGSVPILGGMPSDSLIGLNANYILEFLALAKGETVAYCYPAMDEKLGHVAGASQLMTTDGFRNVLMPMKI